VHVLEARRRVGGRVHSVPFGGAVVERGAEFVLPGHDVVTATCARLGLALAVKGTRYGDREPRGGAPTSRERIAAALRTISDADARGALGGSVVDALESLDLDPAARAAIVARVEVSTAHAAAAQPASILREASAGFGAFDTWTVAGGNQRVADVLAAGVSGRVELGTAVHRIVHGATGVRVVHDDGEVEAEACVVAVPAWTAGAIAFEPPLPEATVRALARVRAGHAAKLFVRLKTTAPPSAVLSVPERFWTYTQLGPDGAPAPLAGSFAGTASTLERLRVDHGPEHWLARVRALRPELAIRNHDPLLATWHDDPWIRGAVSVHTMDGALDDAALARPLGALAFAGEHTAGEYHATMEGAVRSGLRAADEIRTMLRRRPT
jgi:monoamine oxidase